MDDVINTIIFIGYLGPYLLASSTIFFMRNKHVYLCTYIVGIILNSILNYILKCIIQDPRPNEDKRLVKLDSLHGDKTHSDMFDKFGMPSGQSQAELMSTTFTFLVTQNNHLLFLYLGISLINGIQRIYSKNNTYQQIIVGGLTGIGVGYIAYLYGFEKAKGKLREKADDDAPI